VHAEQDCCHVLGVRGRVSWRRVNFNGQEHQVWTRVRNPTVLMNVCQRVVMPPHGNISRDDGRDRVEISARSLSTFPYKSTWRLHIEQATIRDFSSENGIGGYVDAIA
jgi:hypothetical protein